MLTIGELASYAGVTVRAVRHYHAKGLLAEPGRDHAGYRRYDVEALIDVIKIRTLSSAGVPLARVRELLAADQDDLAAAVHEISTRLQAEIRQRQTHLARIAELTAGESLVLPPPVVALLDRLRGLGVDERIVVVERDGWIPLTAMSPERCSAAAERKLRRLDDAPLVELYLTLGRMLDGTVDDAALVELADRLTDYLERIAADNAVDDAAELDIEPSFARLLDILAYDAAPQTRRLSQLLRERGWAGWTVLQDAREGPQAG